MNDYTEVRVDFSPCSEDLTDIAAALLADAGFETFVPDAAGLTAYIPASKYTPALRQTLDTPIFTDVDVTWNAKLIEGQDWNSEWEKHYFKPIVIEGRCVIHSSFHTDVPSAEFDIVIDPKMALSETKEKAEALSTEKMEEVKETTEGSKTSEVLSPAANIETVKNQKVPAVTPKRKRMVNVLDVLETIKSSSTIPKKSVEVAEASTEASAQQAEAEAGPSEPTKVKSLEAEETEIAEQISAEKTGTAAPEASSEAFDYILRHASGKNLTEKEKQEA